MELHVGDKVRIKNRRGPHWNGVGRMDKWMGKIVTINEIDDEGIFIKEDAGEHSGGELYGWCWQADDFEPLDRKETLFVRHKGKETIGILKEDGKEIRRAVARCSPEDTYNFQTGVELVMKRIFSPEQPKSFDMKVVCVSSATDDFTLGKVYEIVGGTLIGNGTTYYYFRDLEDVNMQMCSQFIEFVE